MADTPHPSQWTIHGERIIDDTRRAKFSIASVELPDGVTFEQYVIRAPKCAMAVVLDGDAVLMIRRHRWIIDRWVWELPGGYVDGDDPAACAAQEVLEETGWQPGPLELLVSFQPMVGTVDSEQLIYLARGATATDTAPDINEAAEIGWIPLAEVQAKIAAGEIVGSASVAGLQAVLLAQATGKLR